MLKAYWLRLLLFGMVGALIAGAISAASPKKYEALVQMLIDQKPMSANVPLTSAEQSVSDLIDFNRPRSLATSVQQLASFQIIREACVKVAAQSNLPEPRMGDGSSLDPIDVMNNINIIAEAQSDIVELRVRNTSPDMAAKLANEIYLGFIQQNRRNSTMFAEQAIVSLKAQYDLIVKELQGYDQRIEQLRNEAGTPDLMVSVTSEIQARAELERQRDTAKADIATAIATRDALARELSSMEKKASTTGMIPSQVRQGIERDIALSRVELAQLRERYTDEREEVKAARQKVWNLEASRKSFPVMIPAGESLSPDTAFTQMRSNVAGAAAAIDANRGKLAEIEAALASRSTNLARIPKLQKELQVAQRNQAALERLQLTYADRLKSLEAAKSGRLSPVADITPAIALPDPVSPRTQINLIIGTVAGLLLGVLSMLATEAKRQPVRSLAQLNALALRPVYRLVPELREPYRGLAKAPAESFDSLLTNYLRSTKRPYRVAVVGINKDSGATTAAMNLAIAASRHGAQTLLVQCDPRGGLPRMTGAPAPESGTVVEVNPMIKGVSADSILGVTGDRNPEIAAEIRGQEADLTVIDLEPTTKSAEYAFIAPHVDEVILLVRAGKAKSVEFLQAQQALKESGCPVVTVAFTRSSDLSVVSEAVDLERTPTATPPSRPIES